MSDQQRGRTNRAKGNSAERELVRHLNDIFDVGAKTSRAVGHGTQSLHGDIVIPGHPEIVIEVKNTQTTHVGAWLDQLADECAGIADPLAMIAWRTSPSVEAWVFIVAGIASDICNMFMPPTPSTMRDIVAAVRLGFDDLGDIHGTPTLDPALICSGSYATDLLGARLVGRH